MAVVTEYVTLDMLKTALKLPDHDQFDDEPLERAIRSASRQVDDFTGRRFYLDDVATARSLPVSGRVSMRRTGEQVLLVDDIGSTVGLTVEIGSLGGTGWSAVADYDTEPGSAIVKGKAITGLVLVNGSWGYGSAARVRVTAAWGWPAVPAQVVEATLIQAVRLFRRKDSPDGVTGSAEWGPIRVGRFDPDVQSLLSKLTLPAF